MIITYMGDPVRGPMVRRWKPGRIQVRVSSSSLPLTIYKKIHANRQTGKSARTAPSDLKGEVVKETFHPIHSVVGVVCTLVCHPDWVVDALPSPEPDHPVVSAWVQGHTAFPHTVVS